MYKKERTIENVRKTYNLNDKLLYRKKTGEGIFTNDGALIGIFECPQVGADKNYIYVRDSLDLLIYENKSGVKIKRHTNAAISTLSDGKGIAFIGDYAKKDSVYACYFDFFTESIIRKLEIPTSYKGAYANENKILLFPREKGIYIIDKNSSLAVDYLDYDYNKFGGFHKIIGSNDKMLYFTTSNRYILAINLDMMNVAYSIAPESFHPFTNSEEIKSNSTRWTNGLCLHKGEIVNLYKASFCRISISHEGFKVVRQVLDLEKEYHFNMPVASRSFYFEDDIVVAANTESGYVFVYDLNTQQVLWSERVFAYGNKFFDSLMSIQANGELIYILDKSYTLHVYTWQNGVVMKSI